MRNVHCSSRVQFSRKKKQFLVTQAFMVLFDPPPVRIQFSATCYSCPFSVLFAHSLCFLEQTKPLPTLKDNDFVHDICKINIGEQPKERLLQYLRSDIAVSLLNKYCEYL